MHCIPFYRDLKKLGPEHERLISKVDLFNYEKIFIPIHVNLNHWTLCEIDVLNDSLRYYDSLGGNGDKILDNILQYLQHEHKIKKKKPLNINSFKQETVKCPQQGKGNTTDCGIFAIAMADHLARNLTPKFSQKDMPDYRNRIAYEILTNKLFG